MVLQLESYLVDGPVLLGGAANVSASGRKAQDNDRVETDEPAASEAMWAR